MKPRMHVPYWSSASLPGLRERASRQASRPLRLYLAWSELLHGNFERARRALEAARSGGTSRPERSVHRLHAFLIDRMIRLREGEPGALDSFVESGAPDPDRVGSLMARGYRLLFLGRRGLPTLERARLFGELAAEAEAGAPALVPEFLLRQARSLLEGGSLGAVRELCRRIQAGASRGRTGGGCTAMAQVLERVATAYMGEGIRLEGVSLVPMNPVEALQASMHLCEAHLRLGHWEQAEELAIDLQRRNQVHRSPEVAELASRVRASTRAFAGRVEEAALSLGPEPAGPDLPLGALWRRRLLEARLAAARLDLAGARARLAAVRPVLEARQDAAGCRDADLLELELEAEDRERRGSERLLRAAWEAGAAWEDRVDRWRLAVRILVRGPEGAVAPAVLRSVEDAPAADSCGRYLGELVRATRELVAGDRGLGRRLLARLESPPRHDLPERSLGRWQALLSTSEPGRLRELLAGSTPTEIRAAARMLRRAAAPASAALRPRGRLLAGGREVPLDEAELLRAEVGRSTHDLWVSLVHGEVWSRGRRLGVDQSPRLMELLACLVAAAARTRSPAALLERVWKRKWVPYETDTLVCTGVSRLRKLLPDREWIETVDGEYRLRPGLLTAVLLPDAAPS